MKVRVWIPATITVECEVSDEDPDMIWDAALEEYQNGDYLVEADEEARGVNYEVLEG